MTFGPEHSSRLSQVYKPDVTKAVTTSGTTLVLMVPVLVEADDLGASRGPAPKRHAAADWVAWLMARRTWWVLTGWLCALDLVHRLRAISWHYFVTGSRLLASPSALHLYATHHELQIGPIALAASIPFALGVGGADGKIAAIAAMSAAGLGLVAVLRRLPTPAIRSDLKLFLAGLLILIAWSDLVAAWGHPDDVGALLFAVVALQASATQRTVLAAVSIGLATDCKPWAIAFIPILLLAERRKWLSSAAICLVTIAIAWLPFYLADRNTLAAGGYRIVNSAASSLRVLGVHSATTPSWCRSAQILLGIILGVVAVGRHRPAAIILLAVIARLLLDPATKFYYDAGLLVGTAVFEWVMFAGVVPWLSASALILFYAPAYLLSDHPHQYGLLRTGYLFTLAAFVLLVPANRYRPVHRRPAQRRPTSAITPAAKRDAGREGAHPLPASGVHGKARVRIRRVSHSS